MKDVHPVRRTLAAVLFVVGFVWLLLGLGVVQGSTMSNNAWAALIGLLCIVGTGFMLGPAVLKRPFPTKEELEQRRREEEGTSD